MNENKEKPKSLVVSYQTWLRLSSKIHFAGIKSMDDLINKMLDVYEKEKHG